jgi:hypothetical protein
MLASSASYVTALLRHILEVSPVLGSIAISDLPTSVLAKWRQLGTTHLSRLSLDVTVPRLMGIVGGSFDVEPTLRGPSMSEVRWWKGSSEAS